MYIYIYTFKFLNFHTIFFLIIDERTFFFFFSCGCRRGTVPVHGELGHQGDVGVVHAGFVLVVEEVQVRPVDGEALAAKLVAGVVLVQL